LQFVAQGTGLILRNLGIAQRIHCSASLNIFYFKPAISFNADNLSN